MKIGVISDTHIPVNAKKLPQKVCDLFKKCDLIIHAGDIVEKPVIDELEKLAETRAVYGNMDSFYLKQNLPEKIVIDVAGKKIGVMHGRGAASKVPQLVKEEFPEKLDIVIFGHSHDAYNKKVGGTIYFNPGSATDRIFSKMRSCGIIEIIGDEITAEIIRIED